MLTSENENGTDLDKIAKVKLCIQRMYSAHPDSQLYTAEKKMFNLSDLHIDNDLTEVFIYNEGITIDKYAREVRVNKLKELLVYTSLSAETICQKLYYSSVDKMESELLQQTGLRISFFQNLKKQKASLAEQPLVNKKTGF